MNPKGADTRRQVHVRPPMHVMEPAPSCPICGEEDVTTTWAPHSFEYGSAETAVTLQVRVPVHRCGTCEFEYLDDAAERLRHGAVCDHLGVLAPDEIRRIREDHDMSRAAFARVTGLGEASLNRWENGLSIQSHANDRYLRLLARSQNMRALQDLLAGRLTETRETGTGAGRFRVIEVTAKIRVAQEAFRLRPAA